MEAKHLVIQRMKQRKAPKGTRCKLNSCQRRNVSFNIELEHFKTIKIGLHRRAKKWHNSNLPGSIVAANNKDGRHNTIILCKSNIILLITPCNGVFAIIHFSRESQVAVSLTPSYASTSSSIYESHKWKHYVSTPTPCLSFALIRIYVTIAASSHSLFLFSSRQLPRYAFIRLL